MHHQKVIVAPYFHFSNRSRIRERRGSFCLCLCLCCCCFPCRWLFVYYTATQFPTLRSPLSCGGYGQRAATEDELVSSRNEAPHFTMSAMNGWDCGRGTGGGCSTSSSHPPTNLRWIYNYLIWILNHSFVAITVAVRVVVVWSILMAFFQWSLTQLSWTGVSRLQTAGTGARQSGCDNEAGLFFITHYLSTFDRYEPSEKFHKITKFVIITTNDQKPYLFIYWDPTQCLLGSTIGWPNAKLKSLKLENRILLLILLIYNVSAWW